MAVMFNAIRRIYVFVCLFIFLCIKANLVYCKQDLCQQYQLQAKPSNSINSENFVTHGGNIKFTGFGHISINVPDIEDATVYYETLLGAKRIQEFPHFKNIGFAKSAGFLDKPESVDVSIRFLEIPRANLFLELFQYHTPKGAQEIKYFNTNDLGGVRHICLRVRDIDEAFNFVRQNEIVLINQSTKYKPFKIDRVLPEEFKFFDSKLESDISNKIKTSNTISQIRYFYFIDKFGIQWELEEGHDDIGT